MNNFDRSSTLILNSLVHNYCSNLPNFDIEKKLSYFLRTVNYKFKTTNLSTFY